MEIFYVLVFGVLAVAAGVLEFTKPAETFQIGSADFLKFRNNYVLVYSLMMGKPTSSLANFVLAFVVL